MAELPEKVSQAWENREGPIILSTVNESGQPNAIYATCVSKFDESTIVVADNYFDKTKNNILNGSKGAILFMDKDKNAYQIKGNIEYHQEGEIFKDMECWNPDKH
ncbi:MAG: pyridoxamine 5'-phosphate oxidase family protein, partial [Candidatus Marinimicrobia bacterium]|nr:pyridoxamine 5'-phosphate oxidase family protein [Candidatus Neomarinimicrobiota bacterium]